MQVQGTVKMWVDIQSAQERVTKPAAKLNILSQGENLEARIIIWKTDSLKPPEGASSANV
jgi:hypothetical protein